MAGTVIEDEARFEVESGIDVGELEGHHALDLRPPALFATVGGDARVQEAGLADVERAAVGVQEGVDATARGREVLNG